MAKKKKVKQQVFTRREVLAKLNKLASIMEDKAAKDMNDENGVGSLFDPKKEFELSNFNLKEWLNKNV